MAIADVPARRFGGVPENVVAGVVSFAHRVTGSRRREMAQTGSNLRPDEERVGDLLGIDADGYKRGWRSAEETQRFSSSQLSTRAQDANEKTTHAGLGDKLHLFCGRSHRG